MWVLLLILFVVGLVTAPLLTLGITTVVALAWLFGRIPWWIWAIIVAVLIIYLFKIGDESQRDNEKKHEKQRTSKEVRLS